MLMRVLKPGESVVIKAKPNLCVDFDDTLVVSEGEYLELKPFAREALLRLKDEYTIVIFSSRNVPKYKKEFAAMVSFLNDNDVYYDFIAEVTDGKIPASYYIDDKAVTFKDNWKEIMNRVLGEKK